MSIEDDVNEVMEIAEDVKIDIRRKIVSEIIGNVVKTLEVDGKVFYWIPKSTLDAIAEGGEG